MFDKYFTPLEVEHLIPTLEQTIEKIRTLRKTLEAYDEEFSVLTNKINISGGLRVNLDQWSSKRLQREAVAAAIAEEAEALNRLGGVLKDLKMGLVDFPALMENEEIFLCWKSGETQIQYWHRPTEGYANRKPLTADLLPSSFKDRKSVQ